MNLCVEYVDYLFWLMVKRLDLLFRVEGFDKGIPCRRISLSFVPKACHLLFVMRRRSALLLEPGCVERRPRFPIFFSLTTVSSFFCAEEDKAHIMKNILRTYEAASGQNLRFSTVVMSLTRGRVLSQTFSGCVQFLEQRST